MKESYDEGVTSHIGPESCAGAREGSGEALTGVRAGRVLSREIPETRVLTLSYGRKARRVKGGHPLNNSVNKEEKQGAGLNFPKPAMSLQFKDEGKQT